MAAIDKLNAIKAKIQSQIDEADAKKAALQSDLTAMDEMAKEFETEKKTEADAQYDAGVKQHADSTGTDAATDKIFSLEEYNEGVAEAVAPIQAQVKEAQAKSEEKDKEILDLKSQVKSADAVKAKEMNEMKKEFLSVVEGMEKKDEEANKSEMSAYDAVKAKYKVEDEGPVTTDDQKASGDKAADQTPEGTQI